LRRVARSGNGWMAVPRDLAQLEAGISTVRRAAEGLGRDPAAIGVASSGGARSVDELLDILPRLAGMGVTIVNLPALFWTRSVSESIELMAVFARRAL
jgi:hypothetical protein